MVLDGLDGLDQLLFRQPLVPVTNPYLTVKSLEPSPWPIVTYCMSCARCKWVFVDETPLLTFLLPIKSHLPLG